jgi:hypothetical protein
MEQKLIIFLKKPVVLRSLYFISCMVISFGLGIITEYSIINQSNDPVIELPSKPTPLAFRYKTPAPVNIYDTIPAENVSDDQSSSETIPSPSPDTVKQFVGSKTGTKYYPPDCGGINRIKIENRVYFATEQEAQDKGYTRTTTCN